MEIHTIDAGDTVWRRDIHLKDIINLVRLKFTTKSHVRASIPAHVRVEVGIAMDFECFGEGYFTPRYNPYAALVADVYETGDVYGELVDFVLHGGERSPTGEAAIVGMRAQTDIEDLFLRICAPDESKRITTGGISTDDWYAPIELAGTYNADGNVARDVALSWLYLHNGDRVEHAARLSLDALAARVDAAPKGTRIGVSTNVKQRTEHTCRDIEAASSKLGRPSHRGAIRRGARAILPTDVELTREQVLEVLDTPPLTLLDALEAAAVPDDEWRAAEEIAIKMIKAKHQGEPTVEVNRPLHPASRPLSRPPPPQWRRPARDASLPHPLAALGGRLGFTGHSDQRIGSPPCSRNARALGGADHAQARSAEYRRGWAVRRQKPADGSR
jgi:hypothetical protein